MCVIWKTFSILAGDPSRFWRGFFRVACFRLVDAACTFSAAPWRWLDYTCVFLYGERPESRTRRVVGWAVVVHAILSAPVLSGWQQRGFVSFSLCATGFPLWGSLCSSRCSGSSTSVTKFRSCAVRRRVFPERCTSLNFLKSIAFSPCWAVVHL